MSNKPDEGRRINPLKKQVHSYGVAIFFFPTGFFVVYTGSEGLGGLYDLLEITSYIELCSRRFHWTIGIPCPRKVIYFIAIYWAYTIINYSTFPYMIILHCLLHGICHNAIHWYW